MSYEKGQIFITLLFNSSVICYNSVYILTQRGVTYFKNQSIKPNKKPKQ